MLFVRYYLRVARVRGPPRWVIVPSCDVIRRWLHANRARPVCARAAEFPVWTTLRVMQGEARITIRRTDAARDRRALEAPRVARAPAHHAASR